MSSEDDRRANARAYPAGGRHYSCTNNRKWLALWLQQAQRGSTADAACGWSLVIVAGGNDTELNTRKTRTGCATAMLGTCRTRQ